MLTGSITTFAYIWQYKVKSSFVSDFIESYKSNGEWANLFKNANGYIKTELLKDSNNPFRFVTIDYWDSVDSWEKFRKEFSEKFKEIDKKCENYTNEEVMLGEYNLID